jgi:hypothetical protein
MSPFFSLLVPFLFWTVAYNCYSKYSCSTFIVTEEQSTETEEGDYRIYPDPPFRISGFIEESDWNRAGVI